MREGNQEVPHFEGRAGARAETETGPDLARRLGDCGQTSHLVNFNGGLNKLGTSNLLCFS